MPNLSDISSQRRQIEAPIIDWRPDHPQFRNPGIFNLRNALPSDTGLYKPIPGLSPKGVNGLKDLVGGVTNNAGQLQGFRDAITNQPFYYTAAANTLGNQFHLFQFSETSNSWIDVTPLTPPPATFNAHAYFSSFGTRIYATAGSASGLLAKTIGTADRFASITNAPRFTDAVVIRGFLMGIQFIRTVSPFDNIPTGVSWSGNGDPENWIDVLTNPIGALAVLRGETQLEGGGRLQRIVPGIGGADAIIIGESKIWRVTFIGPPAVWDFQVVEQDEGTTLPTTVVSDGQVIFFRGRRGWMVFDGANATPIGAGKVDYAFIRRSGDTSFSLNGDPLLAFNRGIRSAVMGEPFTDSVAAFLYRSDSDSSFEPLQTDTLETLETDQNEPIEATISSEFSDTILFVNKLTGAWGNLKVVLQCIGRVETNDTRTDAPIFRGLDENLKLVSFDATTFEAIFESAEVTGDVNNLITVRQAWPFVNNNNCRIQLLFRNKLGDAQQEQDPRLLEEDASIPINESGRFVALRMTMPEGEQWLDGFIGLAADFADLGIGGVD